MVSHLTLAVAQAHTLASTSATLAALARTVERAAQAGVDLILFPEAYLGGYPRGASFGSAIGARTDDGREQFLWYYRDAVDLGDTPQGAGQDWVRRRIGGGGDQDQDQRHSEGHRNGAAPAAAADERRGDGTREELERIARESGVLVVAGVIERAGGSLYCAVVYIDPVRGCIGKRRKVMPTATERLVWAQGSPSTLRAVKTTLHSGVEITLAAAVCWENYMPLLRASLYAQGVNIYLAPTADGRDTWLPLMRTIAHEGRTFVLSANQCIRHADLPDWITMKNGQPSSSAAGSSEPLQPSTNARPRDDEAGQLSPRSTSAQMQTQAPKAGEPAGSRGGARRRSSVVTRTTDNHEITWPSSPELKSAAPLAPLARQKSITVAEGPHEVCLPAVGGVASSAAASELPPANGEDTTASRADQSKAAKTTTAQPSSTGLASRGGSCIVAPDGKVLAGPLWDDTDGLLVVTVDLDDCIRGKLDFDSTGHYSRSDAFELKVRGLDLHPP